MGFFNLFKHSNSIGNIENISLKRLAPKLKEWKVDTVCVSTSRNCKVCKNYDGKIYSVYGWNKKYPKLPEVMHRQKCPDCGCSIGITLFQPGINSKLK